MAGEYSARRVELFFLGVRACAGVERDGGERLAMIGDFYDLRIARFGNYFGAPGISVRVNFGEADTLGLSVRGIFKVKLLRFGGRKIQKRCI